MPAISLEQGGEQRNLAKMADDLPLFSARPASGPVRAEKSALADALAAINPDELAPKAALEALYTLKSILTKESQK